jgi:hypothetical protein
MWAEICRFCGIRQAEHRHHCFPQTKYNLKVYGRRLINADFNLVPGCSHCHSSHRNVPEEYRWSEEKFRQVALSKGFELPEGTKEYRGRIR